MAEIRPTVPNAQTAPRDMLLPIFRPKATKTRNIEMPAQVRARLFNCAAEIEHDAGAVMAADLADGQQTAPRTWRRW